MIGGGLLDINASGHKARQNGDKHQEIYVPTTLKAAQLAQLKAKRDTTIIGSTVSGKKVEVDTVHDLHMQSLQDVDNFKEHSKSAGFSVSSKPNFKNPTGSISASVGRIDSKWKSVTHQAGIYAGEDGYTLNVGNGTTLEGAVIKSEAPKAKNTLTTKSLEIKDIQNEAEYTYSNNGIGYNYYGSKKKLEEMKTNDKKGYDKIYNNIGLVPNLGVGSKGKASSTTQSAISDGILTVDGKEIDTKTENTYTERRIKMMELQKRIDILDLWDEMPYSLDIKDFGNTVILLSESCEIRFINCIEVNIKSDILFKNESMKFHEYRNHEYDIQDISVEPCVVKTDGTLLLNLQSQMVY